MLNLTLILLILSYFGSVFSPPPAPVEVPVLEEVVNKRKELAWSESRQLTWNDFAGAPDSHDPLHAITSTNIDMKAKCVGGKFKFEVKSVFLVEESWSKNKISTPLLLHEQLHFDLTEVYARKIRKELNELKDACGANNAQINLIVNRIFDEWKQEQDRYDEEVNHGLHKEAQQKWAHLISLRLAETLAYQNVEIPVITP
ncbi:hypothetical protein BH24BAC1_BH24BAC1_00590 [soil metagenome]